MKLNDTDIIFEEDDRGYGRIAVHEHVESGKNVRILTVNDARESGTYTKKSMRNELLFRYTHAFNRIFEVNDDIHDTLLIGGAGFSYPKYYISHFPDKKMDVVEINRRMVELAMKYFYLDELYDKYELDKNDRLHIYVTDGSSYLERSQKKYDAIINDAYIGDALDRSLMTSYHTELIRRHLSGGGVYVVNIITALMGEEAKPGIAAQETLKSYFSNIVFTRVRRDLPPEERQNCILIASDRKIPPLNRVKQY